MPSQADPIDFTGRYNTALPAQDETQFQTWAQDQSKTVGRDVAKDLYDYDLRGWWQQNQGQGLDGGHLTDTFKKPNHPTFSTQSQYHGADGNQGGEWAQQPSGAWSFTPGATNMTMHGPEALGDYFKRVEPGNQLNQGAVKLTPVEHDPFRLSPVDHDPFSFAGAVQPFLGPPRDLPYSNPTVLPDWIADIAGLPAGAAAFGSLAPDDGGPRLIPVEHDPFAVQ